jgi:hypothetical protein
VAEYVPEAWALVIVQVATPELSVVVDEEQLEAPPLMAQMIAPVGVPPGPITVAVKTRFDPVEIKAELSMTVVSVAALLTTTELSWPEDEL